MSDKNIDKDTKKFLDNMGNRLKLAKENGCKVLDCKTIDNNIKLRLENIKLRKELETYKKIAERLADTILEMDAEGKDVYEKICKNLPSLRCDEIEEGRCDKCIIDWARKEVEGNETHS